MTSEVVLEKTPQQIEAIEKETRSFECPCCHAQLQFRTRVHITSVGPATTREEVAARDGKPVTIGAKERERNQLLNENAHILTAAKETGVFDAFNRALETTASSTPLDRDAYFIKWLQRSTKQKVPQFALRQCIDDYNGGVLELFGWQNVSVVLCNKEFRVFIPRQLVNGEPIEKLEFSTGGVAAKTQTDLSVWIRTRFGYVQKSGEFAKEMRKHSMGAFAST